MVILREDLNAARVDLSDVVEAGAPRMEPIHPGEHLAEFMSDYDLTAAQLGRELDVPHNRILAIVAGTRAVTADTALRLGRYFGTTPDLWLGLQTSYDLDCARMNVGAEIETHVHPRAA